MLSHWAGMLESLGQPIVAAVGWEVACSGEGEEEASEQCTHAQVEKQPAHSPSPPAHSPLPRHQSPRHSRMCGYSPLPSRYSSPDNDLPPTPSPLTNARMPSSR